MLDEMIERAGTELEPVSRRDLLAEIQQRIVQEAPRVWITQPDFLLATSGT